MYPLIARYRKELDHLAHVAMSRSGRDIAFLLEHSLGRAMAGDYARRVRDRLPTREFAPGELDHVADWLVASVEADLKWLRNVDADGVPKKFSKFASIPDVLDEANRGTERLVKGLGNPNDLEGHENLVAQLEDGYSVVELRTSVALGRESARMQHCVGLGGYDEGVADGSISILSLRDAKGRPHVTMEVLNHTSYVNQVKGKQNRFPVDRYFDILMPWLRESGLAVNRAELSGGYFAGADGVIRHFCDLKDGDAIEGDLVVRVTDIDRRLALPRGLAINGNLSFLCPEGSDTMISIGEGLTVAGEATFANCKLAGVENITAGSRLSLKRVTLYGCSRRATFPMPVWLERMEADLNAFIHSHVFEGGLHLEVCNGVVIEPSARVRGTLSVNAADAVTVSAGARLTCDLSVSDQPDRSGVQHDQRETSLTIGDDVVVEGALAIRGGNAEFGDGLTVIGSLTAMFTGIVQLPGRADVGGLVMNTVPGLTSVPDDMVIRGDTTLIKTAVTDLTTRPRWGGSLRIITKGPILLPLGLHIEGDFEISGASIARFPQRMNIGGALSARHCSGAYIPDGIYLGSSLTLEGSTGVRIPDGLHVEGSLNIDKASVSDLPIGVTVRDTLHLNGVLVDGITKHFQARSYDLEGAIIMDMSDLEDIEDNLWINAYDLRHMSPGTSVGGRMVVLGSCADAALPEGLRVGGAIAGFDSETVEAMRASAPNSGCGFTDYSGFGAMR